MLFLISLAAAIIVAFLLGKPLKKRPAAFYITAALLTVASIVITQSDMTISNRFVHDNVLGIFSRGALGAAFWAVVMWAGALPNGSAPIKKLMPIRGELSITAAILTLYHIVTYGMMYISNLIKGKTGSDFILTSAVCLIMVLIMTPLTVMSFKAVRKKINPKTWKKIQRLAYVFYVLIYVHIMVLFVPKAQRGAEGYFLNILVYSVVFVSYVVMRSRKAYVASKKPSALAVHNVVCTCAIIAPICLIGFFSRNTSSVATIKATKEAPATFTFEAPTSQAAVTATETVTVCSTVSATTSAAEELISETSAATEAAEETVTEAETTEGVTEIESESVSETPIEYVEPETEEPATEAQPVYRYKNGTFEGTGEGYSGTVHVSITIENDYITAFSAYADDDDPDYFSDAMQYVIPQIQRSLSADVDACSGATYSSKGIMEAANNALAKALSE